MSSVYHVLRATGYIVTQEPWTLDLSGQTDITVFGMNNSASLQAVNLLGNPSLYQITMRNCPLLDTLQADFTLVTGLDVSGCGITERAKIDAILTALDDAELMNGSCSMDGGTNAAPGAGGIAAIASLEAKGWFVSRN